MTTEEPLTFLDIALGLLIVGGMIAAWLRGGVSSSRSMGLRGRQPRQAPNCDVRHYRRLPRRPILSLG